MAAYIWTMVFLQALEITGTALMLKDQDYVRKPDLMALGIAINLALLAWGIWVLK